MLVIVPLWFAALIVLITRPIYGLKMIAAFLLGATIGLGILALIVAAYPPFGRSLTRTRQSQQQRKLAPNLQHDGRIRSADDRANLLARARLRT
jgi:hypothetical protein